MQDTGDKETNRWSIRTILRAVLIVTILVIFPLISWVYLKGGIEFRKDALKALVEKDSIGAITLIDNKSNEYYLAAGNKRVFACFFITQNTAESVISDITSFHQQFSATGEVETLVFTENDFSLPNQLSQTDIVIFSDSHPANIEFIQRLKLSGKSDIFILDKEGVLRNYYSYDQVNTFRDLVTHTAVLIPPNNNRSVRQKNNAEL